MNSDVEKHIAEAAEAVEAADAIIITAGAGAGVDSGLPDFRGNKGFWKAYPPIARLGISFSEMANPRWFDKDPKLAWAFYGHRLKLYRNTTPHKGFSILLEIGKKKPGGYFVFTSNVDGQFQKAGFNEMCIEECHGSIHHFQCTKNCRHEIWSAYDINVEVNEETFQAKEPLPECLYCKALARPNILMFGDWSWLSGRSEEQARRFEAWLEDLYYAGQNYAIIEIGAGEAVPTVRYKSETLARRKGARLIRINPRDYQAPPGHISIPMGAREGLEKIYEKMKANATGP